MTDATFLQSPALSAHAFRAVLASFSTPATPVTIAAASDAPAPLLPVAATVVLTLADYKTPIWLSPTLNVDAVRKYLRFHTGAPLTTIAGEAAFALLTVEETHAGLPAFNLGTHEYPDRSTTLIVQVAGFSEGPKVSVSGPGLQHALVVRVAAASQHLWREVQNNNSLFPIGYDFMFASSNTLMSLPRSSLVEIMETT
jgi:alpha-D-ribose 1-methylphosphonate 5-triphosphate synthase subunit PhnH